MEGHRDAVDIEDEGGGEPHPPPLKALALLIRFRRKGQRLQVAHIGPIAVTVGAGAVTVMLQLPLPGAGDGLLDRKSTRLNSSHVRISYAVFCLKKKKKKKKKNKLKE